MIKETVTREQTIALLNEALVLDREAIEELVTERHVQCNEKLADHPTIQVGNLKIPGRRPNSGGRLGLLGILNGLFGVDARGFGGIAAVMEEGHLVKFQKMEDAM